MITDLTAPFRVLKNKYNQSKKDLLQLLLEFIAHETPSGFCCLCCSKLDTETQELEQPTSNQNAILQIQKILCEHCILKIHSPDPRFCIQMPSLDSQNECVRFLEDNYGIYSARKSEIIRKPSITHDQLLRILQDFDAPIPDPSFDSVDVTRCPTVKSILRNFEGKIKRSRIRLLKSNQIRHKLKILEEQLERLVSNHSKAVISGNFEDSDAFKEIYQTFFSARIDLQEKLHKHENF